MTSKTTMREGEREQDQLLGNEDILPHPSLLFHELVVPWSRDQKHMNISELHAPSHLSGLSEW